MALLTLLQNPGFWTVVLLVALLLSPLYASKTGPGPLRIMLFLAGLCIAGLYAFAAWYGFAFASGFTSAKWTAGDTGVLLLQSLPAFVGILALLGPGFRWVRIAGWWLSCPISLGVMLVFIVMEPDERFYSYSLLTTLPMAIGWWSMVHAWKSRQPASPTPPPAAPLPPPAPRVEVAWDRGEW